MALSPNEGLKPQEEYQVDYSQQVGMALSPNEGLKQAAYYAENRERILSEWR